VNVGAATVPAGVKLTVPFVPVGVTETLPPVVPTSPFAARVPRGIFPSSALNSVNPAGQLVSIKIMVPRGTVELLIAFCGRGVALNTSKVQRKKITKFLTIFSCS